MGDDRRRFNPEVIERNTDPNNRRHPMSTCPSSITFKDASGTVLLVRFQCDMHEGHPYPWHTHEEKGGDMNLVFEITWRDDGG